MTGAFRHWRIQMTYGENDAGDAARKPPTTVEEMLEATGYRYRMIPLVPVPGDAVHEMGGARMGRDPKTSVLNGHNQAHDVPNLFVTDGAAMSSCFERQPLAHLHGPDGPRLRLRRR